MFICQVSGRVSKPGEKTYKVVTKTRKKDYYEDRTDEKGITRTLLVGHGWEIVEEKRVCEKVYKRMMNESDKS
jgi:hypothetical protein